MKIPSPESLLQTLMVRGFLTEGNPKVLFWFKCWGFSDEWTPFFNSPSFPTPFPIIPISFHIFLTHWQGKYFAYQVEIKLIFELLVFVIRKSLKLVLFAPSVCQVKLFPPCYIYVSEASSDPYLPRPFLFISLEIFTITKFHTVFCSYSPICSTCRTYFTESEEGVRQPVLLNELVGGSFKWLHLFFLY